MLCLFLPFLALKHIILHIFSIFFYFLFWHLFWHVDRSWTKYGIKTWSKKNECCLIWLVVTCQVVSGKTIYQTKVSWMNVVWYGWLWPARLCLVKQFVKQKYHGIPLWTLHHTSKLVRYSFFLLNDQVISY